MRPRGRHHDRRRRVARYSSFSPPGGDRCRALDGPGRGAQGHRHQPAMLMGLEMRIGSIEPSWMRTLSLLTATRSLSGAGRRRSRSTGSIVFEAKDAGGRLASRRLQLARWPSQCSRGFPFSSPSDRPRTPAKAELIYTGPGPPKSAGFSAPRIEKLKPAEATEEAPAEGRSSNPRRKPSFLSPIGRTARSSGRSVEGGMVVIADRDDPGGW